MESGSSYDSDAANTEILNVGDQIEQDTVVPDESRESSDESRTRSVSSENGELPENESLGPQPLLPASHNTAMDIDMSSCQPQAASAEADEPCRLPGIAIIGESPGTSLFKKALVHCGFNVMYTMSESSLIMLKSAEATQHATSQQYYSSGRPSMANRIDSLLLDPKVELVMVATGSPAQCSPIALKTLGIGKNVVCQKALCGTSQVQALRIVEASKYYPSLLSITGFTLRLLPSFMAARKHIVGSTLGRVKLVEAKLACSGEYIRSGSASTSYGWQWDKRMNGGIMAQYGSQIFDSISFILNEPIEKVQALVQNGLCTSYSPDDEQPEENEFDDWRKITADDYSSVHLIFKDKTRGVVTLNGAHPEPGKFLLTIDFYCEHGRLSVADGRCTLVKRNCAPHRDIVCDDRQAIDGDLLACAIDDDPEEEHQPIQEIGKYQPALERLPTLFKISLVLMAECLAEKLQSPEKEKRTIDDIELATFEDSLYIQAVLEAVRASSENNTASSATWVNVNIMQEEDEVVPLTALRHQRTRFY